MIHFIANFNILQRSVIARLQLPMEFFDIFVKQNRPLFIVGNQGKCRSMLETIFNLFGETLHGRHKETFGD